VDSAGNLNVGKDASIMVVAGVYHGDESLCQNGQTRPLHLDGGLSLSLIVFLSPSLRYFLRFLLKLRVFY
jgi:hypothetical protein